MFFFACSGPGAASLIAENIIRGYNHAMILGGLLAASLFSFAIHRRCWGLQFVLTAMLVLHPAWTISATRGDCGYFKVELSWICTAVGCLVVGWQMLWFARCRSHRPVPAIVRFFLLEHPSETYIGFAAATIIGMPVVFTVSVWVVTRWVSLNFGITLLATTLVFVFCFIIWLSHCNGPVLPDDSSIGKRVERNEEDNPQKPLQE